MRKDSPVVACSIAALILVATGAALMPSSGWHAVSVVARLGPAMVTTAQGHGLTTAKAAGLGVLAAPALLRDTAPSTPREPQVKVCRRDLPRACNRPVECPQKQMIQRLHLVFPTDG